MRTKKPLLSKYGILRPEAVLLTAVLLLGPWAAFTARAEASPWQTLQNAISQAENGTVISLEEDVTALPEDARLTVAAGKCVTLDLNGHTLNRNQKEYKANNDSVIYIQNGAILTIRSSGEGEGIITGGYHDNGGGILNDGTLILEGGSVTGNTSLDMGGGVYNQAKAHLTVYGDIVSGNSAPRQQDIVNEGTLSVVSGQPEGDDLEDMPVLKRYMAQITILPAVATLLALLLAVRLDAYLSRERKQSMVVIIALVFGVILQNYLEYRLAPLSGSNAVRVPLGVFGYAVRPMILAMFLFIVKPGGRYRLAWALVGVNAAIYLDGFFLSPDLLVYGERPFQGGAAAAHLHCCQRGFVPLAFYPDHAPVSSSEKKRILAAHPGDRADLRRGDPEFVCGWGDRQVQAGEMQGTAGLSH